ncbi:hypothetical protein MAPG_04994 [Magnaporthiopsis poae ATCC 64411]|uniref:Uncharacterized protein n=1 Tax=Magnaporthiopsis poae (strain ATCC 64411 / 73-15) TaxID=644358 RepID=A0A0C4DY83_MAGP6|nr:hypothetical protein MAPG_04994 [Magnaporthiopsis poae ATCC 64411]
MKLTKSPLRSAGSPVRPPVTAIELLRRLFCGVWVSLGLNPSEDDHGPDHAFFQRSTFTFSDSGSWASGRRDGQSTSPGPCAMARIKLLARSPFRPAFAGDPLDDICVPIRPKHYGTLVDADTIGQLQGLLANHPQASSRPDLERSSSDGPEQQQQQHREVEAEPAEPDAETLELQRKAREWRAVALHNKTFIGFFQERAAAAQQRVEQLERDIANLERKYDGLRGAYEDLGQEFEQLQFRSDHVGDAYRNLQQTYADLSQDYQQLMQTAEESEQEATF